jgi:RNA polymerase sigma factor (sigma-70 family)
MIDWQQIISEHRPPLWRVVFRLLGHYDDALDCCQEALFDAHRLSLEQPIANWGAVLTTLGTRRAIDRLRERVSLRRRSVPLTDDLQSAEELPSPEIQAETAELMDRLRELVAELPAKQGAAFWLASVEGFSHEDVGQLLNVTVNESRVLVHRARKFLASRWEMNPLQIRKTP